LTLPSQTMGITNLKTFPNQFMFGGGLRRHPSGLRLSIPPEPVRPK
jgi:hypothetical protein